MVSVHCSRLMAGLKGFFSFSSFFKNQIEAKLTAIVTGHSLRATGLGSEHVELDQISKLIVFSIPFFRLKTSRLATNPTMVLSSIDTRTGYRSVRRTRHKFHE